jgi:hypothetical protein
MRRKAKRETVKGSLAVVVPLVLNSDIPLKATRQLLVELEGQLSRTFLSLPWGQTTRMNVQRMRSSNSYVPYKNSKARRTGKYGRTRLLKVSVEVDAPTDATCVWGEDKFPIGREPHLALCAAIDSLFDRVSMLAFATQLAAPGYMHFYEPIGFINDKPHGVGDSISWVLNEARWSAAHHGWPVISTIPVEQVDGWLSSVPGILDGMGNGPTGRAIAALTQIVCGGLNESSEMGIAWALLGLEALYADGKQGLSQQILRKSEIMLGPRNPKNPRLKSVYDYRSRFLHGSIDMPLAYTNSRIDPPDKGKFMSDTYEYWGIATCMLVATLQQMILRNLVELSFTLILDQPTGIVTSHPTLQLVN